MNSNPPRKLGAAHQLLVDVLSRGPMPVVEVIERAAERGVAMRTLFEARRRLHIETERVGGGKGRPGMWRLVKDAPAPREWRKRKLWFCQGCGELLPGTRTGRRRLRCVGCGGKRPGPKAEAARLSPSLPGHP